MVIRLAILLLLLALPAGAQDSLRLILPETRPVVGEMIPVTIRGEYTGAITLESLTFPGSEAYDWIQYAPDHWAEERIGGKLHRIFERRVALFAKGPGSLTIGPVTHQLTRAAGWAREEVAVTSRPVTIPVDPYPGGGRPLVTPAVSVTDELSADPAGLGDGDTFTRRITLSAEGTMAQFLPQRPSFEDSWLISFAAPEIRETRLTERGPLAVVVWEWHLRLRGEPGTLVPLQFPFFNTIARKMWSAVTLPLEVGATGAAEGTSSPRKGARMLAVAVLSGGALLAIGLLLLNRAFAGARLSGSLARLRRNPHRAALLAAVGQGDLPALRRAAHLYAEHERAAGRPVDEAALAQLDRAIFATSGPGNDFNRRAFVATLTSGRMQPQEGCPRR